MAPIPRPIIDLWLDDIRLPEVQAPLTHPLMWAKTAQEVIDAMQEQPIGWASLDHDLADAHYHTVGDHTAAREAEGTGYTVVMWMAEHDVWPREGIIVHSWNPAGAENMMSVVNRYSPYRAIRRPAQRI